MAELRGGGDNCVYNSEKCCWKGDIMVGGKAAGKKEDTCCESFRERKGERVSNSMNPSRTISIDCEATRCVYNTNYKCYADHVDIKGCGACDCKETACATFKERN